MVRTAKMLSFTHYSRNSTGLIHKLFKAKRNEFHRSAELLTLVSVKTLKVIWNKKVEKWSSDH